jgi:hypothetical protein
MVFTGGQVENFQKILLVFAVAAALGALLILIFWQEKAGDFNVLLMLIATTLGVVGFTTLDQEQNNR